MAKNITVIDENGITVGSTYKKRADGLIKKGRARRMGDCAIMLRTSASDDKNEVKFMANSIYDIFDNQVSKMQARLDNEFEAQTSEICIQILKSMEEFRRIEHEDKVADLIHEQLTAMQSALSSDTAFSAEERDKLRYEMLRLMDKLISRGTEEKPLSQSGDNGSYCG